MKLYDQEAQDLARVVQDVLEGKKPLTEMDPAKHVEQNKETGMFCVYNKAGKKVKEFKDKADAVKYATDNHDELMKETAYTTDDSKSDKPLAKDPRDVKGIHKNVKVTKGPGVKEDINAAHEEALAIEEARQLKDPKTEVMVVKNGKVEVINKKDLKKFMAKGYGLAEDDVKEEESDKQKKYQAFFDKALKKFGVKSPAELEGDKKKEFFDYVDANYEAENEED